MVATEEQLRDGRGRREAQILATLPRGIDSFNTFAFEEADGSTTLYFDRRDCETGASDIYKIEEAQAA